MKTASWIVLLIVGVLILAGSLVSAGVAYFGEWPIGPTTLAKVEAAVPGTAPALRGARGTAAGLGAAFAVLWLTVVLGPYRRGEAWASWALLGSVLVLSAVILPRIPLVGITAGVATAIGPLVLTLLGVALDVGRLRGAK